MSARIVTYVAWALLVALHAASGHAQSSDARIGSAVAAGNASLVVVRCGDARVGTAFASSRGDLLVTTWAVADCPRALRVELPDGQRLDARVARRDDRHDVALLAVVEGLALPPLAMRTEPVTLGQPLVALGTLGGADGLVVYEGSVAQVTSDLVRTDAARPRIVGGPVLDVDGHVLGVVSSFEGATYVVPAAWIMALDDGDVPAGDVRDAVRFHLGLSAGVLVLDARALFASEMFVSFDLWDALSLRVAMQFGGGATTEWSPQPTERSESFLAVAATLGYRFRIQLDDEIALTITPEIGAWAGLRSVTHRQALLGFADPSCDPSSDACALATRTEITSVDQSLVRPTLGVRFGLGDVIELGYQVQLDVEHPEASGHMVTFGFRL